MGWLGSVRLGWVGLCVVLWFWKGSVGLCWLAIMFTTVVNFRHPWRSSLQLSSISCIHCSHVDNCRHFQASSASKSTTVVILGLSLVSSLELSSFSGSHCSHLYNCRHFQASTVPCAHDRGCICRLFAYYLHIICILFAYYLHTICILFANHPFRKSAHSRKVNFLGSCPPLRPPKPYSARGVVCK